MKDMEWEVLRRGRKRSVSNFWEFTKKFFLTSEIFGLSQTTNFNYGRALEVFGVGCGLSDILNFRARLTAPVSRRAR